MVDKCSRVQLAGLKVGKEIGMKKDKFKSKLNIDTLMNINCSNGNA